MKVEVGNKQYKVAVADDDRKRSIGLSKADSMKNGQGLLMRFDYKGPWSIRMSDMSFPLDLVFVGEDDSIVDIQSADAGSDLVYSKEPYVSVLELNKGDAAGLKVGDKLNEIGEKRKDGVVEMAGGGITPSGVRHVLDEDGKNQMNLLGGERIFSRKHTKRLIELAKNKDYAAIQNLSGQMTGMVQGDQNSNIIPIPVLFIGETLS
jgi:uncharacterized membrane protein (UPF0127 family)